MSKKLSVILAATLIIIFVTGAVAAQEGEEAEGGGGGGIVAIAAALAIGFAAMGSAYGIAHAGSAALAAMAEKPEIATWGIIIVALAEGLALYGLVIAFMLVNKI